MRSKQIITLSLLLVYCFAYRNLQETKRRGTNCASLHKTCNDCSSNTRCKWVPREGNKKGEGKCASDTVEAMISKAMQGWFGAFKKCKDIQKMCKSTSLGD